MINEKEAENADGTDLEAEIVALAPWHIDVQVTNEISTAVAENVQGDGRSGIETDGPVRFVRPRDSWEELMRRIYPDGLEGRSFLECACNCGAYCFWAKEPGAGRCHGFDVREHWIKQARFLQKHRTWPADDVSFEVRDLYKLPESDLEQFDVTMFQGIFYHLPDPITGLKAAADKTRELLILDTAIRNDTPDGMLALAQELVEEVHVWLMQNHPLLMKPTK